MNFLNGISGHFFVIPIIGTILLFILYNFIIKFYLPAERLKANLIEIISKLETIQARSNSSVIEPEELSNDVMTDENIKHLWNEYWETLHPQKALNSFGQEKVVRWRATTMAEMYFTEEALVDIPLKAEFYQHLPGILTGIGIIGTFAGLIVGLINFKVSGDASIARASLNELIHSVGFSFLISAAAITMAMVFTWLEKSRVTDCHNKVEEICRYIDSFFDAGAGEEYLSRIVAASETSATQALQIKDSLVADLKQILSELINQQIEASISHQHILSSNIAKSLNESIKEPIERISHAVDRVGSNQGEAVNRLLTDVLSNFTAQMNDMFGGQLKEVSALIQQTAQTIQSTSSQFSQLAENVHSAGKSAADVMAERLNEAISSLEARQQIMNRQMGEFVDQIRNLVRDSQSETAHKMHSILEELGLKVTNMVNQLETQSRQASEEYRTHHMQLTEYSNSAMGNISDQIQNIVAVMSQTSEVMRASVASLTQATRETIERLNSGAKTLYIASSDFAKAGEGVSNTLQAANQATEKLQLASSNLAQATNGVRIIMDEYKRTNEVFSTVVVNLRSTIENARREASMTSDIIDRIQKAADKLGIAQNKADEYLLGMTNILAKAHEEFAGNIEKTLRKSNTEFLEQMSKAVSLLRGAIQELGDVLDSVSEMG